MSDHIAHIAICDDVTRLAARHPEIDADLALILRTFREDAHLGTITRHADKWSADLLAKARDAMAEGEDIDPNAGRGVYDGGYAQGPLAQRKIAFVLGSLTHRAADRLTKPITHTLPRQTDDPPRYGSTQPPNESKILQDIFVFKEVYASGCEGDVPGLTQHVLSALTGEPEANMEHLFRILLRRAMIAMHTINPDDDHADEWLTAVLTRLQTFPKSMYQYAELAAHWPEDKVQQYLIKPNFYNRQDPLIRLARDLQRGSAADPRAVLDAHRACDTSASRYARALAKALDYLLAAGELYRREIEIESAKLRFDVGVPELSLKD